MADTGAGASGAALPAGRPPEIVLNFGPRQARPAPPAQPLDADLPHRHAISFSGSGSEYFRIWIVNLLLIIVTLTLYYPWAKVRKLRYFHTNTQVAGHALDFHGQPRQMLRGYLLVVALAGAYALASSVSPGAEGGAFLILALLWPALWRASLQFRLANTSWRGLRFAFTGSLGGAYAALLLPWLLLLGLGVLGGVLVGAFSAVLGGAALVLLPLLALAVYALLPYLWLRLKRYQHGHYAYAGLQTELDTPVGTAYGSFLRIAGVAMLAAGALLLAVLLLVVLVGGGLGGGQGGAAAILVGLAAFAPVLALLVLLLQVLPRAYATARLQNLLWSGTGGAALRFESGLRFGPLARLMLKNWLLVIVTLGLYWPWAAIALTRLRLEAVGVSTREPLDALGATGRARSGDAAGEAAGDLFGVDLGL